MTSSTCSRRMLTYVFFTFGFVIRLTHGNVRVSWSECNIEDHGSRFECGFSGITEEECYMRECCWSESTIPGSPWCYHSKATINQRCMLTNSDRNDCGYYGIRKEQCLSKECCWQPSDEDEIPWCYHKIRLPLQVGECGRPAIWPNVRSRIVGGIEAIPHSWPWQVSLQRKASGSHFCGASVISDRWVVSAAHCSKPVHEFVLAMGVHALDSINNSTVQIIEAEESFPHEYFNLNGTLENDLWFIKTKEPIQFNDFVSPVCISSQDEEFEPGTECYLTGWGTLTLGGEMPNELQQVMQPILEQETCQEWYTDAKNFYGVENVTMHIDDSMICSGYEEGGRSGCHGDSGGPLVCYINDRWKLAGAVSWGGSCGYEEVASVFARVSMFVNWMEEKVNEYS